MIIIRLSVTPKYYYCKGDFIMTALEKIILYRNYKQAEKTHKRLTDKGYYSLAKTVADLMCDMEDKWTANGFDISDLIFEDPYELMIQDLESLPTSTYNDFVIYYTGGIK